MSVHEYASSLDASFDDVELLDEPEQDRDTDNAVMVLSWMAAGAVCALAVTILAAAVVVRSR